MLDSLMVVPRGNVLVCPVFTQEGTA